jgi:hypothetical protein
MSAKERSMFTRTASLALVLTLTACASTLKKDELKYQDYAGEPISSFWMPRQDGWSRVDDTHIVIRTQINKEYLLTITGFCPDLNFAEAIGVTSTGNTVDLFEKVIVGKDKCMIREIRPIDSARMKADRKALAEKKKQESKK